MSAARTNGEPRVAILGATSLGRALARKLARHGTAVTLWTPEPRASAAAGDPPMPEAVEATTDLARAARCDLVFMCVAAHAARPVARALGDVVRGDQILVHAARGLEADSGLTVSAVVQEETCLRKIGVMGGALRAGALDRRRVVAAVVASHFDEVPRRVAELLRSPGFRVQLSQDVPGVEIAGAYRGIAAVWIGAAEALDLGPAVRAMIMTEALSEATRLAARLGANPLTFTGYAGVGDLVATAADPAGKEHEAGAMLVKGVPPGPQGPNAVAPEAAASAAGACVLAARLGVTVPGAEGLRRLFSEGGDAEVMIRAVLDEIAGAGR
jgi:glycerol-3-phosphate dehydrogenase (NAD(P)+)